VLTTKARRVLVADDDERIVRFTRLKLMASGYDVVTAMTGHGALTMIESENPDIVVLDLRMPGMGGLEVLRIVRSSSQLPVIVVSAATDLAEKACVAGANDYLPKPFDPNDLVRRIEKALEGRCRNNRREDPCTAAKSGSAHSPLSNLKGLVN
jgi:DNA-binding response OmpR family regulator